MSAKDPSQYELWADLAKQNKHLRRNNWFHWFVHLILVFSLFLSFNRPLMAIRVDQLGQAQLVNTANATVLEPGPEEAQQLSRTFSQYLLEVTSGSVARDLSKALGLMTAQFQRAYREKAQNDPTLAALEKGNIRSELTFDDAGTQIKAERDPKGGLTRYFVTLSGTLKIFRADILTAPLFTRPIVIRTTLLVVPRSPRTLNGLLVDFFEKEVVETPRSPTDLNVNPLAVPQPAAATGARP